MEALAGPTNDVAVRSDYSAAKQHTIDTAIRLFAEHGVSGTSLQMIADAAGITKAAVYHQFRTKDEIVVAVVESELAGLAAAVSVAETQDDAELARGGWSRSVAAATDPVPVIGGSIIESRGIRSVRAHRGAWHPSNLSRRWRR